MQEIARNIDFSLDFQVALKKYRQDGSNTNLSYITNILNSKIDFSKSNLYTSIFFTLFAFATFLFAFLDKINWIYFLIVLFNQLIFSFIIQYKFKNVFYKLSNLFLSIIMLEKIYKVIANEKFNDDTLKKLQDDITNYGLIGIKEVNKIKNLESYTKFLLTSFLFNGLFSINVLVIYFFKRFIDNYGVYYYKSIEALEEFEVSTSLAILGQTKQNITLPKLIEEVKINFNDLKHPLLPESECVANSFNQDANINIITGSNMSGKTSFLRTIGINIILMNAGAYCTAKSFCCPYLKVFTSMRITDDISKGVSTFYAELLRIKVAIDYAKQNKPMIVFIDEIFKGTNSNDRITGAISLIERLNKSHIIIFISTHDFEVCDITTVNITNYHFSEYYEGDKIKFDYKIKQGKCLTTNAKYLMKLAGIID